MSSAVQSQSTFERIQELRAAGDTEGWARLLMDGDLDEDERRALRLTGDEARAYRRLKAERGLTDEQKAYQGLTNGQRRLQRRQQAAYEHLCRLRERGDTYWIVRLVRDGDSYDRAVLTGDNLMPGVPRFELNTGEAEAVKVREKPDPDRLWRRLQWRRIRAGAYRSEDWRWLIEREGSKRWVTYCGGERWGNWILGRRRRYGPRAEDYLPCETLRDMMDLIGEHRWDEGEDVRERAAAANAPPEGKVLAALQHVQRLREAGDVRGVAKLYEEINKDSSSRYIPHRKLMFGETPRFRLTAGEARAVEQLWREGRLARSRSFGTRHKQTYIVWNAKQVDVDEELAPLILALWQAGLDTWNSCQETGFDGPVWIEFDAPRDARAFLKLAGRGDLLKDEQAGGHDGDQVAGWHYEIHTGNPLRHLQVPETVPLRVEYERNGVRWSEPNPACFELYRCSIRFPRADLAATLERVQTNSQGPVVPEGQPPAAALGPPSVPAPQGSVPMTNSN
jgi:hypothetical protein